MWWCRHAKHEFWHRELLSQEFWNTQKQILHTCYKSLKGVAATIVYVYICMSFGMPAPYMWLGAPEKLTTSSRKRIVSFHKSVLRRSCFIHVLTHFIKVSTLTVKSAVARFAMAADTAGCSSTINDYKNTWACKSRTAGDQCVQWPSSAWEGTPWSTLTHAVNAYPEEEIHALEGCTPWKGIHDLTRLISNTCPERKYMT